MVCEQSAPRVATEQLIRSFDQTAPVRFEDTLTSIARPKARATRSTRSLTPPASSPIRCRFTALSLPTLRQIFLGQGRSGRLGLHHDARDSPSACFFDRLNAVDAARDLLAIAL